MGKTVLVRWSGADVDAFTRVDANILNNHNGRYLGRWHVALKSYRSTWNMDPNDHNAASSSTERSITTVTIDDMVYTLLEDPHAPFHSQPPPEPLNGKKPERFTHYRNTFVTLRPPGALENLLAMLKAPWMPVRNAAGAVQNPGLVSMGAGTGLGMGPTGGTATGGSRRPAGAASTAPDYVLEGKKYALGTEWEVKLGLLRQKETIKGAILEAEYLPLPRGSNALVSQFLSTILPRVTDETDPKEPFVANLPDYEWEEAMWDHVAAQKTREEADAKEEALKAAGTEGATVADAVQNKDSTAKGPAPTTDDDEDVYAYGIEEYPHDTEHDWEGLDRNRRCAYWLVRILQYDRLL